MNFEDIRLDGKQTVLDLVPSITTADDVDYHRLGRPPYHIYGLYKKSLTSDLFYIGVTGNMDVRFTEHRKRFNFPMVMIELCLCKSWENALSIEKILIEYYANQGVKLENIKHNPKHPDNKDLLESEYRGGL